MVYERYADALLGAYDLNINPGSTTSSSSSSSSSSQTAGSDPRLQLLQLRNPWGQPPSGSSSSSSAGGVGTWQGAWSDGAKEWSVVPHARAVTGYDQVSASADRQIDRTVQCSAVRWSWG